MTNDQIKNQIDAIEKVTNETLAGGKKACKKFLCDAGIIPDKLKLTDADKELLDKAADNYKVISVRNIELDKIKITEKIKNCPLCCRTDTVELKSEIRQHFFECNVCKQGFTTSELDELTLKNFTQKIM